MPELPEIETIKGVIEPQIKGLTIGSITVNRPEIISRPTADEFCKAVTGQTTIFYGTQRKVFNHPFEKWKSNHSAFANDRLLACYAA